MNNDSKKPHTVYLDDVLFNRINYTSFDGIDSFSEKVNYILESYLYKKTKKDNDSSDGIIRYIDLFAGIGGIRKGFSDNDEKTQCVFSSEWDKYAAKTYEANFNEKPVGDITKVKAQDIPDFDVMLAGFPCQPFSSIGKREGFDNETQGTLFFDILRILDYHNPKAFLLENVPGLLTIQKGETFNIIKRSLKKCGYNIFYKVLQATDFGSPQSRKRVIIVGIRNDIDSSDFFFPNGTEKKTYVGEILENNPEGYTISKRLQDNYLFKKDDGRPYVVDKNTKDFAKTLNASYHKIQRLTGTFVKGGKTGIRLLSELECKRLQGFPDDFKMPVSRTQMYKQLGNSVSIPMIKAVSSNLKKVIRNQKITDTKGIKQIDLL